MFFKKESEMDKCYRLADKYLKKSNKSKDNLKKTHFYQKYCHYLNKATELDKEGST